MNKVDKRRLAIFIVAALITAMMMPTSGFAGVGAQAVFAPDVYEPADDATATAKVAGAFSYHTLDTSATLPGASNDVDWIQFRVATSAPVFVAAVPEGEDECIPMLTVYNSSTATGALGTTPTPVWSDWGGYGAGEKYFVPTSAPGTYYAKITEPFGRDGAYNLFVNVGVARRIGGADRYETALMVSRDGWTGHFLGGGETDSVADVKARSVVRANFKIALGAHTVFLATGAQYADALAAGAFSRYTYSPVLLLKPGVGQYSPDIDAEIRRLGARKVYILGGTQAITADTETKVKALPGVTQVKRLWGPDRYGTASAIASEMTTSFKASVEETSGGFIEQTSTVPAVFVASGETFADALAVGPIAASDNTTFTIPTLPVGAGSQWAFQANGAPIVLTAKSTLPSATAAFLTSAKPRKVYVCGGPSAVATPVLTAIQSRVASGTPVVRIFGADRYETAYRLATHGRTAYSMDSSSACLASGDVLHWPDALTGASYAWTNGGPVLLTPITLLSPWVTQYWKDVDGFNKGVAVIGGPTAVSATTFNAFRDLWKTPIN